MDQPKLNVQPNRQMSDRDPAPPSQSSGQTVRFPSRQLRTYTSATSSSKPKTLQAALLALVTGVVLGVLLLVLFKDQSAEATVTTIPPTTGQVDGTPMVKAAVTLPAQSLYAWQLGSFPEREKAEKGQQELEAQGILTVIRGTGPYQLFAAVAPDKKAGAAFEAELNQRKIGFYAKEFKIAEREGYLPNLKEADATLAIQALQGEVKLGFDALTILIGNAPDAQKVTALKTALTKQSADHKAVRGLLAQAGMQAEALQWDNLHKQLEAVVAVVSNSPNLLDAQAKLTAFFVAYENVSQALIRVQ